MTARRAVGVTLGGALLIVVALAFATPPLLVPGVAFAAIGTITPLLVWLPAPWARVSRHLDRRQVVEGERFTSSVTITAGRAGLPAASLCDPLSGEAVAVRVPPSLRGGHEVRVDISASFTRRGQRRLAAPELRICDPLGLAEVVRRGGSEEVVLVLPRTEPVIWAREGGLGRRPRLDHGTLSDAFTAGEIDGLRPYRTGTPASRIHWAALARGAGLLERRLRAEHQARPLVILDSRCAAEDLERLDRAVRAAASLVFELARCGGCELLTPGSGRPLEVDHRLSGWQAAHARLALAEPAARPPARAARRRPGMTFYVAAQAPARVPQGLAESAGLLVLPAELPAPGRWPVAFEVSGCTGYTTSMRSSRALAGAVSA
jgi:uncharacterized protein (DUF58 family)